MPYKDCYAPQKLQTTNGTFKTTKVGDIEILVPEFSQSKMEHIKPNIITSPAQLGLPMYDLIIGVTTMSRIDIKLDFTENSITLDNIKMPM